MRGDCAGIRGYGGVLLPGSEQHLRDTRLEGWRLDRHPFGHYRLEEGEQPGLWRASLLRRLGGVSAVLGLASLYPLPVVSAALAVPLGLLTWLLARRDVAGMQSGRRNCRWMGLTLEAQARGLDGMVFSGMSLAFWLTVGLLWKVPWPF